MVYKLEFDKLPEYKKETSSAMDVMFRMHKYSVSESLLLYKYRLNKSYETESKRGISETNLSKLDLSEIKQSVIFIFQISIIQKHGYVGLVLLRNLIEHCLENQKDIYIPTTSNLQGINNILGEYKHILLDSKSLNREFLLNNLLK